MIPPDAPVPVHEAVGVMHVHSTCSDGCLEPGPILDLADRAGLDYLCFNDHDTLELAHQGWHGRRHGGVLSVVGAEIRHTDRKSHLLVFGAKDLEPRQHILKQLERLKADGAVTVAAHPCEIRPLIPFLGGYPWRFGPNCLIDGVEVWNWMSAWKGGVSLLTLAGRIRFPDRYVRHPDDGAVRLWFQVGGCALGGADAHGHTIMFRKVFSYGFLFDRIRTHLLLDAPLTQPGQIEEALIRRRCFTSNALEGDARGFRASVRDGAVRVELPGPAWISIRKRVDPPVHTPVLPPGSHEIPAGEGPFHIEVYRGGRTWITCSLEGKVR